MPKRASISHKKGKHLLCIKDHMARDKRSKGKKAKLLPKKEVKRAIRGQKPLKAKKHIVFGMYRASEKNMVGSKGQKGRRTMGN